MPTVWYIKCNLRLFITPIATVPRRFQPWQPETHFGVPRIALAHTTASMLLFSTLHFGRRVEDSCSSVFSVFCYGIIYVLWLSLLKQSVLGGLRDNIGVVIRSHYLDEMEIDANESCWTIKSCLQDFRLKLAEYETEWV